MGSEWKDIAEKKPTKIPVQVQNIPAKKPHTQVPKRPAKPPNKQTPRRPSKTSDKQAKKNSLKKNVQGKNMRRA